MDLIKRISALLMAVLFMFASGGILLVHTFCACANVEIASLYAAPDHCEPHADINDCTHEKDKSCTIDEACCITDNDSDSFHAHHDASKANCEKSDITLLKLDSHYLVSNEKAFVNPDLPVLFYLVLTHQVHQIEKAEDKIIQLNTSPPALHAGCDFILSCQQLKIPHSA